MEEHYGLYLELSATIVMVARDTARSYVLYHGVPIQIVRV
jgi:hypothetical protein